MLKTNILTPVLSGVLAVTVAGSGVLYVLDKKDKNETSDSNGKVTVASKVSDSISAAASNVQKAVKGESESGYSCSAVLDFGEVFTEKAGFEVKPVSLKADSKIKGGKSEADLQLAYDSKSLANVYIITDNETGTVYLKCPELGDAYLSMTPDDLQSLLNKNGISSNLIGSGAGLDLPAVSGLNGQSPELDKLQDLLKDIDFDAVSKDLDEYWKTVKDTIPEGEKKDDITGEIAGHSYTYEVKTVDVTIGTLKDIITAVTDKAKNDQLLKDSLSKAGISESQYDQLISSLSSATDRITDQQSDQKLFSLDVYSYEGEEVGFNLDVSGMGTVKIVAINTDEVFAIDMDASVQSTSLTINGAFEMDGDAINGSADFNVSGKDDIAASAKISVKDLVLAENNLKGSIGFEASANGKSVSADLTSAGTAENPDIALDINYNGKKALGLKISGEKTGASDVTVPSGEIYPMTEEGIKSFQQSCNVDGFKAHIKEVLGDVLYSKLTENSVTKKLEQNKSSDADDQKLYKF